MPHFMALVKSHTLTRFHLVTMISGLLPVVNTWLRRSSLDTACDRFQKISLDLPRKLAERKKEFTTFDKDKDFLTSFSLPSKPGCFWGMLNLWRNWTPP